MPDLDTLRADLADELAELDALLAPVGDEAWLAPTPAAGWDVRDSVSHLAGSDAAAVLAVTDPDAFTAGLPEIAADPDAWVQSAVTRGRTMAPPEVLAWWRHGSAVMLGELATLEPTRRIPWFGPPMGPASFITARLMETWAHGQDIADALGVRRRPSQRLRHVADLGVRTRGFAYAVRGRTPPPVDIGVDLAAPDGSTWSWGPADAPDRVSGPALDFCLLVTQRRHPADLDVRATGLAAEDWLTIAQAFAGPPGPGRPPRRSGSS